MQPGVYKFINRQSGTAMDLHKNDYACVVGSPPCDDSAQNWEIAPLGAGYAIRNMQTGTYLSVKELHDGAAVFAGHFPASWQIITVKWMTKTLKWLKYTGRIQNIRLIWPTAEAQLLEQRLWKPVFLQHIHHSVLLERAGKDDETSSTTTINAADVPEGGELVFVTTTTTRTVVTKVPKQWSKGV
ncbi:hypothetical protein EDB19DRAFT_1833679 [Suillus lakei]|nr:hypothetical protein EDB19DRAFT_1833679 [Suillus lakei]